MKKEFWLGAGLFAGLVLFRKPLKRMIVFSAGATMALADKVKEVYLNMVEEAQDIFAEACAAYMVSKKGE